MDLVRSFGLALAAVVMSAAVPSAAQPSRIVILRHGEKADAWKLCAVGDERAAALAANYLGKGAANSLFDADGPAAIVAITLHTLELIAPTAASWACRSTSIRSCPSRTRARPTSPSPSTGGPRRPSPG